jgi:uncharacterized protein (TIGR03437 family)
MMLRIAALWLAASAAFAQPLQYSIRTFAGVAPLGDNGPATAALMHFPVDVAIDAAGNLWIADEPGHRVRRVSPGGIITTVLGNGIGGYSGDGGQGSAAQTNGPRSITIDPAGNVYVGEFFGYRIRKISPSGIVTTVAGNGSRGFSGEGGQATNAQIGEVNDVALLPNNILVFSDATNHILRQVNLATGIITKFAGTGTPGLSGDGGPPLLAQFSAPHGLAADADGRLFVADTFNCRIRVIHQGVIRSLAGSACGYRDAPDPNNAQFHAPRGVSLDPTNPLNLYVADQFNNRIRLVTIPSGSVTTVTGNGRQSFSGDNGPLPNVAFNWPYGVTVDRNGALIIADTQNARVRRFAANVVSTIAGDSRATGSGGPASNARFFYPRGIAYAKDGSLYISDFNNVCIRRILPSGNILPAVGICGVLSEPLGPLTPGYPIGVAVDDDNNIFFGDLTSRVFVVTPGGFAGRYLIEPGVPAGMAFNAAKTLLYIADRGLHVVWRIDITTGAGTIIAGRRGEAGFSGDGGPADQAHFNTPEYVAVDPGGAVYVSDTNNHRIRRIGQNGFISTVAGTGRCNTFAAEVAALDSNLCSPEGIIVDSGGNLVFAERDAHRIRRLRAVTGIVETIAGSRSGQAGFDGDGALALQALLYEPRGLALDSGGDIYFADGRNHRIRVLSGAAASRLEIAEGNNQIGPVGTLLASRLGVRVVGLSGAPLAGISVSFAVTQGSGSLSAPTAISDASGIAAIRLTLGAVPGPVHVTASSGRESVTFVVQATGSAVEPPRPDDPRIFDDGVVGAGSSVPPVTTLAPNMLATVYGNNFAPAGTLRTLQPGDIANGRLPTVLAGACVTVGGTAAPVLAVLPGQINFQAPAVSGSSTDVRVTRNCGTPEARISAPMSVSAAPASPQFFFFVARGDGRSPAAAANAITGAYIGPPGLIPGAEFRPARPGDIVTIYTNGFGATDPAIPAGTIPQGAASARGSVSVRLGDRELSPGDILYAGVAPGQIINQLNIRIPADAPSGDLPLSVSIGGRTSPPGAFLAVER